MRDEDLEMELMNSRPPGGQHGGGEPRYVKVTHKPTGIFAACSFERSQHKNLAVAKRMVEYGLAELGWKDE